MKGFHSNIEKDTLENSDYRRVLYTGKNSQLVLMTLQAGEEIGEEVHDTHDQFFRFEEGEGRVVLNKGEDVYEVTDGDAAIVPAGVWHNVINTGGEPLRLYTLYSPPEHKDGTVHATKAEAVEEHFDGITTE